MSLYKEKEYWNNRLKKYGAVNTSKVGCINPIERRLIEKYVCIGNVILDYGAGDGRLFSLYNEIKPYVQGVDIADFTELINKEKQRFPDLRYDHYILNPDLYSCQYPDDNFKACISFAVFMHIRPENIERLITEIMRISEVLICSSYNGELLAEYDEQHCFLHNYEKLFKPYEIIETEKIGTGQFWVVKK